MSKRKIEPSSGTKAVLLAAGSVLGAEAGDQAAGEPVAKGAGHVGVDICGGVGPTAGAGGVVVDPVMPTGDIPQSPDSAPSQVTVEAPAALAREGESRSGCWERLRKEARAAGLPRGQGEGSAYRWATEQVDRLFIAPPPKPAPEPKPEKIAAPPDPPVVSIEPSGPVGLADLPADWPVLPSNASLAAEISWVQANRLRVVSGDIVDLTQSLSPAPSHAAIGWLETSIRAYSKYCDIAARATAQQQDEAEHIRRERLSIEDVRALLAETLEADS